MHWNVALDALPGSATFVCVWDRWLNDYFYTPSIYRVSSLLESQLPFVDNCDLFLTDSEDRFHRKT